ncbi:homeodomain-only protein-like [Cimex lectularius]|uniref:Homeodomain-only protein n=1 Tax=Cimex lectularius TaxID=79782 RepID=A0A8I6R976_CIMLE|nr:homeodomain-only protein-like [Cimex lectularius]
MLKTGARTHGQRVSRLTLEQEATLETEFSKGKTLHETDLALLAAEIGANETDVREWYIQRVATWRRSQGLSDCFGQI